MTEEGYRQAAVELHQDNKHLRKVVAAFSSDERIRLDQENAFLEGRRYQHQQDTDKVKELFGDLFSFIEIQYGICVAKEWQAFKNMEIGGTE